MKRKELKWFAVMGTAFVLALGMPQETVYAAQEAQILQANEEAAWIQMPGFVLEQWNAPRLMKVYRLGYVREAPDKSLQGIGRVDKGQYVRAWGQTDTGWYFIEFNGTLAYVRYEAAAFVSPEEQKAWEAQQAAQAQQVTQTAQAQAAQSAETQQPVQAAGIVFIGDSRMVTLKEAVERNLGPCPAAVVAKGGSRVDWFRDSGIPQADRIIGKGSRVVINMGVNDMQDVNQYAQLVNACAAVWAGRGAQVYYASVNPVWANSYGMTEERVQLFNASLQAQLIPQVTWLDSHTYLMQTGVHASDGVHYKDDTNLVLYDYYMTMIGAK